MDGVSFLIRLTPTTVVRRLGSIIALLIVANIAVAVAHVYVEQPSVLKFVNEFNLDREGNFPTYFSGLMLLFAALLLAAIAQSAKRRGQRFIRHWQALAVTFLLLSVDEVTSLHEMIGEPAARVAGVTGAARPYFWMAPAMLLVLGLALSYVYFLLHVPSRYRRLFLLSGAMYVGGAIGFEIVSAWYQIKYGEPGFLHAMIFTVEEALEMCGVLLFIYALLHYLRQHVPGIRVEFTEEHGGQDARTPHPTSAAPANSPA
jgi:hypothetical protein